MSVMSSLLWLIVFFLIICTLSVIVYVITVKTFYWGDKKEAPTKMPKPENKSE
jgi:NADH:ubiquinone oxidoreductase subunit 2 (subunit N)